MKAMKKEGMERQYKNGIINYRFIKIQRRKEDEERCCKKYY